VARTGHKIGRSHKKGIPDPVAEKLAAVFLLIQTREQRCLDGLPDGDLITRTTSLAGVQCRPDVSL
jgi:hypothetical protein